MWHREERARGDLSGTPTSPTSLSSPPHLTGSWWHQPEQSKLGRKFCRGQRERGTGTVCSLPCTVGKFPPLADYLSVTRGGRVCPKPLCRPRISNRSCLPALAAVCFPTYSPPSSLISTSSTFSLVSSFILPFAKSRRLLSRCFCRVDWPPCLHTLLHGLGTDWQAAPCKPLRKQPTIESWDIFFELQTCSFCQTNFLTLTTVKSTAYVLLPLPLSVKNLPSPT